MSNGFFQNVNSLLAVILAAEKKEQERYYDAVNSNASDSTMIMAKANARIKKLRDVINRLKNFQFEVMEIFEGEEVLPETHDEISPVADNVVFPGADYYVPPEVKKKVLPKADNDEDLIKKVCEALIVAKPFKFLSIESSYAAIDPTVLVKPVVKLSNSMYVSTAAPADAVCKDVLSKCGIEEHEFNLFYEGA